MDGIHESMKACASAFPKDSFENHLLYLLGFAPGISRPGFPGKFPKFFPPAPGIFSPGNPGKFDWKIYGFLTKLQDFQQELGQIETKMTKTKVNTASHTSFDLLLQVFGWFEKS